MISNSLHARDIASLVHQQSDLDAFNREDGTIVARGEGCRVWDVEGRE
jgi:adenosylmethionine-8-amino-7-oxononanoate aminotransferase